MDDIPDKANISLKYCQVNNVSLLTLKYVAELQNVFVIQVADSYKKPISVLMCINALS
jgi:hypothetical protein